MLELDEVALGFFAVEARDAVARLRDDARERRDDPALAERGAGPDGAVHAAVELALARGGVDAPAEGRGLHEVALALEHAAAREPVGPASLREHLLERPGRVHRARLRQSKSIPTSRRNPSTSRQIVSLNAGM